MFYTQRSVPVLGLNFDKDLIKIESFLHNDK